MTRDGEFYGRGDQDNKVECYMRSSNFATWKKGNWQKMGVQDEEECKRRGGYIQSRIDTMMRCLPQLLVWKPYD